MFKKAQKVRMKVKVIADVKLVLASQGYVVEDAECGVSEEPVDKEV